MMAGSRSRGVSRHIIVDILGMILGWWCIPRTSRIETGPKQGLTLLQGRFPRLPRIWADGNYAGELMPWVFTFGRVGVGDCRRPKGVKLRAPTAPVDRGADLRLVGPLARLSKDYEALPAPRVKLHLSGDDPRSCCGGSPHPKQTFHTPS